MEPAALADSAASYTAAMSPTEYRDCLADIGWSMNHVAVILDVNPVTARRWGTGAVEIPAILADWLRTLAHAHRSAPWPIGWRSAS